MTDAEPLPDSRLYTFVDEPREFALYFLEGQKLIEELALMHDVRGPGFAYFRDVVLSVQPTIALLKPGEQLGFYIDSADPFFRLKIETAQHGATRCALLPENFDRFPEAVRGIVRHQRVFPNNTLPYESVIEVDDLPLRDIVNRVLKHSYQVNSAVIVSQRSDQSAMLSQLPPLAGNDDYDESPEAVQTRRAQIEEKMGEIFASALHRPEEIRDAFAGVGFELFAGRTVEFRCACSKERVVQNLLLLGDGDRRDLFVPGEDSLEVTCEYCKSRYRVSRDDLEPGVDPVN